MLVDSHCHLEFPDFGAEQDAVLGRARAAGIGHFLTISTRVHRFEEIARIAEAHNDISCSLGTHPHSAEEEGDITIARLVELGRHPKVVAIGETGLDYYYDNSPRDLQQEAFRRHIRAALELDMPVIVHTRDAEADTMRILREEGQGTGLTGVLHCFSSSPQLAEEAVLFGFHISFSGIVTFKKSEELRETARNVPLDRMLVETDAPFLAPIPKRGQRNEPAFVVHTANVLAGIHGLDPRTLAERTTANFFKLFSRAIPARQ
ncbi:MAG: LuxR family transcriptional regulator [Rhodospirillales bacterium]|nr:LuxR family transcriptional regulator [Rhodospirillales bacterium]